jgi:3-oxoacyl-[acyl-carrier protein] reductase
MSNVVRSGSYQRVAAISGCQPHGTGAAIARHLALRDGFCVFVIERNQTLGLAAVDAIRKEGGDVHLVTGDITVPSDVQRWMDTIATAGQLHALVNCACGAGNPANDNIELQTYGEYCQRLDVNGSAHFLTSQAAILRFMKHQGDGVIVNFSSTSVFMGEQVGYCAGKGTQLVLTNHINRYCGPRYGTRAHLIVPGTLETNSVNAQKRRALDPLHYVKVGRRIPRGRVGTPEDVAGVVSFVISPAGSYLGAVIPVEGGVLGVGLLDREDNQNQKAG